jgi:hypothetical protein
MDLSKLVRRAAQAAGEGKLNDTERDNMVVLQEEYQAILDSQVRWCPQR